MVLRKLLLAAFGAATLVASVPAAHADWYRPSYQEDWRERRWHEFQRERAWREREWRERHHAYTPYGYGPPQSYHRGW